MAIPCEISAWYKDLTPKERWYAEARWRISPIPAVAALVPKKGLVYDIGCGIGLLANVMALGSAERSVVGYDLSPEKIHIAGRSIAGRPNIAFRVGDATRADFARPDAITACDLLHHIPYAAQEQLIASIYLSLSADGIFILQDIGKQPLAKYLFAVGVDKVLGGMGRVYYRTAQEWKTVLEKSGFIVTVDRIDKGLPIAALVCICSKRKV